MSDGNKSQGESPALNGQVRHLQPDESLLKRILRFLAPTGSRRSEIVQGIIESLRPYRQFNRQYHRWIALYDAPNPGDDQVILEQIGEMTRKPLISVIMPVYNPNLKFLREAIDSVIAQVYDHWELCLADDASSNPAVGKMIRDYAKQDRRIRFVFREENGHISAASNSALSLATGEFIVLLDHDDKLHPRALFHAVQAIHAHPDCEIIYSDEDKITRANKRVDPYFKTDFDYELLLNHNYLIHMGVYRRATVEKLGGFRLGYEGSQDYDLNLRMIDGIDRHQIYHLPQVLYHWRISVASAAGNIANKPYAADAAQKALQSHFARNGQDAVALYDSTNALYHPFYPVPDPLPAVNVIVFSRTLSKKTQASLLSLLANTAYKNYHLTIIAGKAANPPLKALTDDERVTFQACDDVASRTNALNDCVQGSSADFVCLIDESLHGFSAEWLAYLVGQGTQPGVGAVGAKLITPKNKIFSNGMVLGLNGWADHLFRNLPVGEPGYRYWAWLQKGYSALSSGCLLLDRLAFLAVGGFDPQWLRVDSADIDLGLKLREAGLRLVLMPSVMLKIDPSVPQLNLPAGKINTDKLQDERAAVKRRWNHWFLHDPSFNPHLSQNQHGEIILNLSKEQ